MPLPRSWLVNGQVREDEDLPAELFRAGQRFLEPLQLLGRHAAVEGHVPVQTFRNAFEPVVDTSAQGLRVLVPQHLHRLLVPWMLKIHTDQGVFVGVQEDALPTGGVRAQDRAVIGETSVAGAVQPGGLEPRPIDVIEVVVTDEITAPELRRAFVQHLQDATQCLGAFALPAVAAVDETTHLHNDVHAEAVPTLDSLLCDIQGVAEVTLLLTKRVRSVVLVSILNVADEANTKRRFA
mmetsp:Transcript_69518/g.148686  ORF Transcript_69518/g.148686 Transcript_69518/m.148686 type:complete len:237 (-) Transcript_69518:83-793(-)